MSIPWLTVLQHVPWSDVLNNAPKVADGAKKLWNSIGRKSAAPEAVAPADNPALSPEERSLAALQARLATLDAAVADLHEQMLASSELIKALAEQNARLIERSDSMQRHLRRLFAAIAVTALLAGGVLLQQLNR